MYTGRLFRPHRIALLVVQRTVFTNIYKHKFCTFPTDSAVFTSLGNMSQRSITSFFRITPKKEQDITEEKLIEEGQLKKSPGSESQAPEKAPVSNGKVKLKHKRQRLESSGSEGRSTPPPASEPETTPPTSQLKKKPKRQRLQSSSSEGDCKPSEPHQPDTAQSESDKTLKNKSPTTKKIKVEKSPKVTKSSPKAAQLDKSSGTKKVKSPLTDSRNTIKSTKEGKANCDEKSQKSLISSFIQRENKGEELAPTGQVAAEAYDPSSTRYDPVADACWALGAPVPYVALAHTLRLIEATSGRLRTIDTLANYLRSVMVLSPEDLVPSVYLCLNQLAPAYHSLELGVAESYLMKAVAGSTGSSLAQVRAAARRLGDLGAVAQDARHRQTTMLTPRPLTVRKVFDALREIARMTGHASVAAKISKIQTLYIACRDCEAKYLIRSLEGKLRVGLAEQSVLQALALATTLTPPPVPPGGDAVLDASKGVPPDQFKALVQQNALTIKGTYCECPNYERVLGALLAHGVHALRDHCRLEPGVPLKPMLAHPTRGVAEVFSRFDGEQFTCEWKYDGERTQLHVPSGADGAPDFAAAGAFSRSQEPQAGKYPDVLRRLPALLKPSVRDCVLDAEAVAYDPVAKQILPFQVLSTRKRKQTEEGEPLRVQVCVFVFDVLYLNGRALVREPLAERRRLLREHFNEVPGEWRLAEARDCNSPEEVQAFLEEAVRGSCEGLMVKALHGPRAHYDIARRSRNWLKLKKDYVEGCGDSVDAVVVGAWWGKGKRAGRFGGFLLACLDADADEFQSLCKIGTGFSDEDLVALTEQLKPHAIDAPPAYYRYDDSHVPDVWLAAQAVWEVRCADLSLSPAHRAAQGLVAANRGISLRFPRFVRARPDKRPEQATSARQVAAMYRAQDQVRNTTNTNTGAGADDAEDDFY